MLRRLKWLLILLSVRLTANPAAGDEFRLGPVEKASPKELSVRVGSEPFDPAEVLRGAYSSPAQCARVPNGMWIELEGRGECIRYYASGLDHGPADQLLVYLGGDAVFRTSGGVRFIAPSYFEQTPDRVQTQTDQWSQDAGMPGVYLARPGTYGSSGSHLQRRLPREIALMDAALDRLKERYKVSRFILAGQSGGGHLVAALLNRREDIAAAVIASGIVSVRQVVDYWDRRRKVPDAILYDVKSYYDPVMHIARIRRDPAPEIYVLSDPEDHVVPFFSQLYYVRRLRAEGFSPHHLYARGTDANRHVLADGARLVAAMIARGRDAKDIRRALTELDLRQIP